jgi:uncharacterized protein YoxC
VSSWLSQGLQVPRKFSPGFVFTSDNREDVATKIRRLDTILFAAVGGVSTQFHDVDLRCQLLGEQATEALAQELEGNTTVNTSAHRFGS